MVSVALIVQFAVFLKTFPIEIVLNIVNHAEIVLFLFFTLILGMEVQ